MSKFEKILFLYKFSIFTIKKIIQLGFSILHSEVEEKAHISFLVYVFISLLDIAVWAIKERHFFTIVELKKKILANFDC